MVIDLKSYETKQNFPPLQVEFLANSVSVGCSATQSSSEHAEEVDSTKAKRPHRGKKSKKHKIVSAEVEEDEEHCTSK